MIKLSRGQSYYLIAFICSFAWILAAIQPLDLAAWALEQIAPALCLVLVWLALRSTTFSLPSLYGLTFLFVTHTIGTHYTYSMTPYDLKIEQFFGFSINDLFGWERNHYDRFVHLIFGVTTALPLYQFMQSQFVHRKETLRSFTSWFHSMNLVISLSAIYELLEWMAAVLFSKETGNLYLGSQGDIWDAQADIALAWLGFTLTYLVWHLHKWIVGMIDRHSTHSSLQI